MLSFGQIITVLLAHWVADFVCQTHWMATNKSKSLTALGLHVATYTWLMLILTVPIMIGRGQYTVLAWGLANGALHFVTDFFTSKATAHLWKKGDVHNFFVVVGFDQLIHYACLFYTLSYIV